jgi:cobalt-zinc-cadmium efflux system outer membrane protein
MIAIRGLAPALALLLSAVSVPTARAAGDEVATVEPASPPTVFQAPVRPPDRRAEATSPAVEPAAPLTLYDALGLALEQNPDLQERAWAVRSGEAREVQARKIPNPEVDVRVWRFEQQSNMQDVDRWRVIVSEEFETGGKRHWRRSHAAAETAVAGADFEAWRAEVESIVGRRFVAVLGAQRRVDVWTRLVEYLERLEQAVVKLVDTGSMRPVEVYQVRRRAGLARIELHSAETDLDLVRARLAATWGNPEPRFTEAIGNLERALPVLPDHAAVLDMAESAPLVERWDAEVERGEAAISLVKSTAVPDVKFGIGARRVEQLRETDYMIDVEIDLPIFDRKQGDIREAKYDLQRTKASRASARALAGAAVTEAYLELSESSRRRAVLADDVLPAASAAFEAFRLAFETAADNLDDLVDARRDVAEAESDYVDALVDYHQALATLEGLLGQPVGTLD